MCLAQKALGKPLPNRSRRNKRFRPADENGGRYRGLKKPRSDMSRTTVQARAPMGELGTRLTYERESRAIPSPSVRRRIL